ncbi:MULTISPECIES: sugar phosphate isomerase/epimerase [Mycobacteriaceae]|uniref:TIM barrel protein n=1 Tax=Mycolicibacterium novocastrense TaxID=59813 RepID=A0AAW5SSR1_MYCNV|nr:MULTISPECIES: TIM barrel protein [Mycobacteriaceae]MCV7027314.1 TIM barrel protein [Mycolicibacterium novocastrense]OBB71762.1 xylose isomerase [Mycobacterium sp. 852014-52144_SCH5372336]UUO03336.1 sugar phosphate isomerase/epimerase [Mycolicibacterium novocastrense]GAT07097.1 xylose isomerase-like enzyme [Mycolicibacterium novocastrense]
MRERLSVHSVTFYGAPLPQLDDHWQALGVTRLSLIDSQLSEDGLPELIERQGYSVDTVYHLFTTPEELCRVIDAAAAVGTRVVYMLTGGRGALTWDQAAERFCSAVAPGVEQAARAGVGLAVENASALYADIHIAHTLRDTVTLAEMAGLDVCIDLFHCWAEAGFPELVERALPRTQQIQVSDYVLGDRALPARAVPGDGAIPIEPFLAQALAAGYPHGFDLELIGPRIQQEGPLAAANRACDAISTMLDRLES